MWMTGCKGLISFVSSIVDLIHEYNHVTVLSHVYWANQSTIKELLVVTLSNTYQMQTNLVPYMSACPTQDEKD